MKRLFIYISVCFACLTMGAQELFTNAQGYPKREARAVWLTTLMNLDWPRTLATDAASMERQKRELCTMLDRLKASGFNQVLLQTRIRGSVIYPSKIEPWDRCLTGKFDRDPGYDPLAFAIAECHRRGMECHAWMVTINGVKMENVKAMGKRSLHLTQPAITRKHGEQYYLDPGMPATATYLTSICQEIVRNYDVDGIHFDYIRYPENASSFPDADTYRKYGNGQSKAAWRRANITRIVRAMYTAVKAIKPWVKVSSSPVGKYADLNRFPAGGWNARDAVFQEAQAWLQEGIHDAIYPMMYFQGNNFYPFADDWQEHSHGRMVIPGLGTYFLDPKEGKWTLETILREMYYLRDVGTAGQCQFRAKFVLENHKGINDFLGEAFYAYPALVPAATWIDSIAPTQPQGLASEFLNGTTERLTWHPAHDNMQAGGIRYNVYASPVWPIDITRAENLVAAAITDTTYTLNRMAALCHGRYIAITAMDRCGNESSPVSLDNPHAPTESEWLMQHDGHTLQLPSQPGQKAYIIRDITGRRLRVASYTQHVNIERLQPGYYQVYSYSRKGVEHRIGAFRK